MSSSTFSPGIVKGNRLLYYPRPYTRSNVLTQSSSSSGYPRVCLHIRCPSVLKQLLYTLFSIICNSSFP